MGEIVKRENLMKFKIVVDFGEKKIFDGLCNVVFRKELLIIILDMCKLWWFKILKNEINFVFRLVIIISVVFIYICFIKNLFCLLIIVKKKINLYVWKYRVKIIYCWYVFIFLILVINYCYCKLVYIFLWLY